MNNSCMHAREKFVAMQMVKVSLHLNLATFRANLKLQRRYGRIKVSYIFSNLISVTDLSFAFQVFSHASTVSNRTARLSSNDQPMEFTLGRNLNRKRKKKDGLFTNKELSAVFQKHSQDDALSMCFLKTVIYGIFFSITNKIIVQVFGDYWYLLPKARGAHSYEGRCTAASVDQRLQTDKFELCSHSQQPCLPIICITCSYYVAH